MIDRLFGSRKRHLGAPKEALKGVPGGPGWDPPGGSVGDSAFSALGTPNFRWRLQRKIGVSNAGSVGDSNGGPVGDSNEIVAAPPRAPTPVLGVTDDSLAPPTRS